MLNPVAKKWVEALRSGEYKQGRTMLRRGDDSYCCLGILCELAVEAKILSEPQVKADGFTGNYFMYDGSHSSLLPLVVKEWVGLSGHLGSYGSNASLALDNDTGKPFSKIADIIESEPEGLFV